MAQTHQPRGGEQQGTHSTLLSTTQSSAPGAHPAIECRAICTPCYQTAMPTALAAKKKTLRVGCLPPKHTPTRLVFGLQVVTLPPRPAGVPTYPCVHGACALGGGTYGSIEVARDGQHPAWHKTHQPRGGEQQGTHSTLLSTTQSSAPGAHPAIECRAICTPCYQTAMPTALAAKKRPLESAASPRSTHPHAWYSGYKSSRCRQGQPLCPLIRVCTARVLLVGVRTEALRSPPISASCMAQNTPTPGR